MRNVIKRPPGYSEPELDSGLIRISQPGERGNAVERLRILWNKRSTLYRWAVIGLVVSTTIAFILPPRYTATTRLMPPDKASQGIASMMAAFGKSSELGALGTELFGVKTSGDLFIGVLKSESVENAIINKFDLRKSYGEKRYQDARKKLENRTDVSADRKSGIITIKVSDRRPERAAEMGREYVEQLNRVVVNLDTSAAHRERIFLESRLKEVQGDLENAEKDFGQFASKNAALDVKEQGRAMIGAAGTLEGQLIAAQTELEGLRQIYTENNVRVRSLQARIAEYKKQLQKMGGSAEGEESGTPSGGVNGESQELYPSIRKLPILGVTWADLYRHTKVEEAVFETLTKQYEMARVEEAREVPTVKVLDVADVPERKSFPPRLIIMVFGTLFVLAVSSVGILAAERWKELDPSDPGKKLGEEMLLSFRSTSKEISDNVSRRFWHRNGNTSV
jgi:capsule polysaccharide export protein KpsE/RkpR